MCNNDLEVTLESLVKDTKQAKIWDGYDVRISYPEKAEITDKIKDLLIFRFTYNNKDPDNHTNYLGKDIYPNFEIRATGYEIVEIKHDDWERKWAIFVDEKQ
jgi:hypothetical protein